jgi:hypothetical protein
MEKTYVFDTAESGGLNSSALIASLMQNKGVDPNLMAMLTNASKNQDAWGGSGCWFMWVILLFWLWGGNGQALSQLATTLNCDVNALQGAITVSDEEKKEIIDMLEGVGCDSRTLESIKSNLSKAELDTGFAYSSYDKQFSIVVIHKASSIGEFINTFEHEKNHLEMHICEALDINPYSEEAAHMSGDLAQLILEEALYSIVEL